ncbi:MAG TPA: aromatic amino acid transport family protein [Candidatus Paceibacterota bacterium]
MIFFKSPFWRSVGIISGLVGAGLFALPYSVNVSGIFWSLVNVALAFFAVLSIHLVYGEVVTNTKSFHRVPGYIKIYLGEFFGKLAKVTSLSGINAIILVYAILAGIFLSHIFGGSQFVWSLVFLVSNSIVLFLSRAKDIGFLNIILMIPLLLTILFISFLSAKNGSLSNISFFGSDPFFSFGVFVFALSGMSSIADSREVFLNQSNLDAAKGLRSSTILGTTLPLILYIVFILGVLMASGATTTEDALSGLSGILGNKILVLGAVMGFLAIFRAALTLSYDLQEIYELDLVEGKKFSWVLAGILPIFLFLIIPKDFVKIISIVGGVLIAIDGILVVFILRKMRRAGQSFIQFLNFGKTHQIALIAIFVLSIIYEFVYQIF